ncbi:TetR family transcriptional regulator [Saccharothrix mutabilis subsp. mutabilis]|uniref:TetR family transcriptional regulator n=1 Tax=Saccharothrix mutabilis subsp. mutabilis TaxID=66855 RepID=A0ABN0TJS8_9PSEU
MSGRAVGSPGTRELAEAERLVAERGVDAVRPSAELVRAVVRRHTGPMERARARMLAEVGGSDDVWDWVACLVRPWTDHLAALGSPTWIARFGARVVADPALRQVLLDEALDAEPVRRVVEGLNRCLPALPVPVYLERGAMTRHLVLHMCAERERALAVRAPTARASWDDTAAGLISAIVGLWLAPVSTAGA